MTFATAPAVVMSHYALMIMKNTFDSNAKVAVGKFPDLSALFVAAASFEFGSAKLTLVRSKMPQQFSEDVEKCQITHTSLIEEHGKVLAKAYAALF